MNFSSPTSPFLSDAQCRAIEVLKTVSADRNGFLLHDDDDGNLSHTHSHTREEGN
jgi:hypothetical protein